MANGSKSRLHNRAITISSRSKRVARRSSQGRETQNNNNQVVRTEPDNNVELGNNGQLGNNTQSTTDLQDEELDGNNDIEQPSKKSAWKKRPRTFDWKLTAAAPGGPLSTELLRGYCGHVACDIWENNLLHLIAHYLRPVYPETRSRLTLEQQYHYFDRAINVLRDFENTQIIEPQHAQGQCRRK
ncbi:uncharacterized protein [Spinacia oleracea]|uniref:Uncharacterized protein isoform X3 n=1 Tax=Spinacia oleracea TaxID=3562 RepID=A0A9R0K634_SPIOL|nr:uncharacterized protein LOC110798220 isoform X3 [Spinacia oleracea]